MDNYQVDYQVNQLSGVPYKGSMSVSSNSPQNASKAVAEQVAGRPDTEWVKVKAVQLLT